VDVGIVGGSGYGGAELIRLLQAHPTFKLRTVAARSSAGRDLAEVFPHLGLDGTLAPAEVDRLAGCDVVFLATPHDASLGLVPELMRAGAAVVDLSGAYRLPPADFAAWYGLEHTSPGLAPAAYGLPELGRAQVTGARLVANPGCFPTAALLALAPLAGLVDPGGVVVTGMTGASGAGKGLRDDLHVSHAVQNVSPYGAPGHRHTPEIERVWAACTGSGAPAPVSFTPHLVPMARGLLATVTARLTGSPRVVPPAFHLAYDAEPFVTVLPEGRWPATTHLRGGNAAHLGVTVDERAGVVVVACAIDNLVKGAAGQAIQNANLMTGLPEASGLTAAGVYP
jgi:N-acetyl-gamma-glutamyl-phosphate reductase